jgi:hypothetical protein
MILVYSLPQLEMQPFEPGGTWLNIQALSPAASAASNSVLFCMSLLFRHQPKPLVLWPRSSSPFGWEPKLQSPISDLHTLGLRISTPATPLLEGGGAACAPQSPPQGGGEGLHLKRMANSPAALLQALPPATRQKFVSGRARTRIFGVFGWTRRKF